MKHWLSSIQWRLAHSFHGEHNRDSQKGDYERNMSRKLGDSPTGNCVKKNSNDHDKYIEKEELKYLKW